MYFQPPADDTHDGFEALGGLLAGPAVACGQHTQKAASKR